MTTLKEAIEALGNTSEEVMAKLREKGIKGNRMIATSCPIAKYLNTCGFPHVTVYTQIAKYLNTCGFPHVTVYTQVDSYDTMSGPGKVQDSFCLPKEVRNWVLAFDHGHYPEFDANPFKTVGEFGT